MAKFENFITGELTDDAVEQNKYGGWSIKMGFAGFNSPTNNMCFGYSSKAKAEAAVLRYQNRK